MFASWENNEFAIFCASNFKINAQLVLNLCSKKKLQLSSSFQEKNTITYQVIHDSVPSWLHTVNSFGETFYGINQAEKNFGAAGTTDTTKKAFGVGTGDDGRKQT